MKYEISVQGEKVAEFADRSVWDACVDEMAESRKFYGISYTRAWSGNTVDFAEGYRGDTDIIGERLKEERAIQESRASVPEYCINKEIGKYANGDFPIFEIMDNKTGAVYVTTHDERLANDILNMMKGRIY